jgi:hypothetical protein
MQSGGGSCTVKRFWRAKFKGKEGLMLGPGDRLERYILNGRLRRWDNSIQSWRASDSDGAEVVLRLYYMTAYERHYGYSSTDVSGVALALVPKLDSMISQRAGTGVAPWLRYHLNRDLNILIACRRYYPDRLVDRFPPRDAGNEQSDPVLLRALAEIASAVDALGAHQIDLNNLLMDGGHAFLSDFAPVL